MSETVSRYSVLRSTTVRGRYTLSFMWKSMCLKVYESNYDLTLSFTMDERGKPKTGSLSCTVRSREVWSRRFPCRRKHDRGKNEEVPGSYRTVRNVPTKLSTYSVTLKTTKSLPPKVSSFTFLRTDCVYTSNLHLEDFIFIRT